MAAKAKVRRVARSTDQKRARRYGRVSTSGQNEDGTISIPDQDRISLEYVARKADKGWVDLGFVHDEETGTSTDRENWQTILAECRRGEVDVIVCAKLDRFARSALVGLQQIAELEAMGVDVVVCDIDLDTTTPAGKAMRSMLLVFAELERDTIVDRMSKGQYGKARNGGWPSSKSAAPYGLTVEGERRDARLVIDPGESATVRMAADLLADEGYSVTETCKTLNALDMLPRKGSPWYPALLREVLSKETLYGKVVWGKTGDGSYGSRVEIPGVPAVLPRERWDAVQRAMVMRPSERSQEKRVYPLTGRMVAPCGQVYQGMRRGDTGQVQYRDSGKIWRGVPAWKPCDCARLDAPTMERRVWAEVCKLLSDPDRLQALAADYLGSTGSAGDQEAELARLDTATASMRHRMASAMAMHIKAGTDMTIFEAAMEQLNGELGALEKRRDDIARYLAETEERQEQMASLGGIAARVAGRLDSMTLEDQKEVLGLLNVRVEVLDNSKAPAIRIAGTVTDIGLCGTRDVAPGAPLSRCSPYWSQVEDYG